VPLQGGIHVWDDFHRALPCAIQFLPFRQKEMMKQSAKKVECNQQNLSVAINQKFPERE
jgi:hypothetical protein